MPGFFGSWLIPGLGMGGLHRFSSKGVAASRSICCLRWTGGKCCSRFLGSEEWGCGGMRGVEAPQSRPCPPGAARFPLGFSSLWSQVDLSGVTLFISPVPNQPLALGRAAASWSLSKIPVWGWLLVIPVSFPGFPGLSSALANTCSSGWGCPLPALPAGYSIPASLQGWEWHRQW